MPPGDVPRPPQRLAALDGLRLVAALAVAVYHYTVGWRIDGVRVPEHFLPTTVHISVYGFLGVELFFLISGFVICMSSWGRTLGDFFTSRVSRLYPAYWACVLLSALVAVAMPLWGGVPFEVTPKWDDVVVNLTMLQQPMGVPSVETVYWTLFVELCFYLLFAIVVHLGVTYRRVVVFCVIWMTVAVLAPPLQIPLLSILAIPEYAPYFVAGSAMYLMYRFRPSPLLVAIVGFAWLVSMHRVGARLTNLNPGFDVPVWPGRVIITLAFAAMLAVALRWTDRIRWRWLTVAGVLTYPFYLLHQRVGYAIIRTAYRHTELPVWSLVAATTATVLTLAWILHRCVERPLSGRLRAGLKRGLADIRRADPAWRRRGPVMAVPRPPEPADVLLRQPSDGRPPADVAVRARVEVTARPAAEVAPRPVGPVERVRGRPPNR
jgi:peptidoglycan/LPS O-acetylase OafA/YrhL